jgi:hypothetical protein
LIHLFVVRVPHVTTFYPIAVHATDSVSGQQPEASAASARKPICERAPLARGAHIRGKCAYLRRGRIHVHRAHRQPVCKLFPRNAASNSLARPDECLSKATEGIARPVFDCASGWFFAIHPHARCASLVYRSGWWSHSSGTLRETPH